MHASWAEVSREHIVASDTFIWNVVDILKSFSLLLIVLIYSATTQKKVFQFFSVYMGKTNHLKKVAFYLKYSLKKKQEKFKCFLKLSLKKEKRKI
jgi:hypothetical protein